MMFFCDNHNIADRRYNLYVYAKYFMSSVFYK